MGWRGLIRSMAAAHRAAERDALRRHRQYERMATQEAKHDALHQAAIDVERYQSLIDRITSIHRDCGETWDWQAIATAPEPQPPAPAHHFETAAQLALGAFNPSWVDRLFGRVERKRIALAAEVGAGKNADVDENSRAGRDFEGRHSNWKETRNLAMNVLAMDPTALRDAVEEMNPFAELTELGSHVESTFQADGIAIVGVTANVDATIPHDTKSLLQSGKLSTKKMPIGQFFELYQDCVAGTALRVARELFALLPLQVVYVTTIVNMLDSSTGQLRNQPILSVEIPRETLKAFRFETLDASDSLRNFNHRMDFKKTKGFLPIEPLVPDVERRQSSEAG